MSGRRKGLLVSAVRRLFVWVAVSVMLAELLLRLGGSIIHQRRIVPERMGDGGAYTILCLGDSTTYGLGASDVHPFRWGASNIVHYDVPSRDTDRFSYPSQLQHLLDTEGAGTRYHVIKAGTPGINSSQIMNRLEQYLATFQPKLVILQVGINDPWSLRESTILQFYRGSLSARIRVKTDMLLQHIALYRLWAVSNRHSIKAIIVDTPGEERRQRGFSLNGTDRVKAEALHEALSDNFRHMVWITKEHHVPLMLLGYQADGWGYPPGYLDTVYRAAGVPIVETRTMFEQLARQGMQLYSADGWHPNDAGYDMIAKLCYAKMASLSLITGKPIEALEPEDLRRATLIH